MNLLKRIVSTSYLSIFSKLEKDVKCKIEENRRDLLIMLTS